VQGKSEKRKRKIEKKGKRNEKWEKIKEIPSQSQSNGVVKRRVGQRVLIYMKRETSVNCKNSWMQPLPD
jgi:hypothetical protein